MCVSVCVCGFTAAVAVVTHGPSSQSGHELVECVEVTERPEGGD